MKGLDPKLRNEFCPQVSKSEMRTVLMMVTNVLGEQSLQMAFIQRNNVVQELSSTSFPPTAPRRHSARDFGMTFAWE